MSTKNSKPEVVMITGASAGIGRATAQAFAKRGAHIGLLARGRAGLEGAKREVEQLGGRGLVLIVDVADHQAVEAAAEKLESEFGPIDIWVNDAMASVFSPIIEMTPEEYRRVTEVTYLGYVWGTMAALRRMRPRNRGTIIHVGSALAYRGIPLQSAYCAAKHAIQGFTDSLRCELIHDKMDIHVCIVEMPAVNTPQFGWVKNKLPHKAQPVPPIFQPEIAADAIVFAATHKRREIYVGFPTVQAIIGNKIAPGILDHYLASYKSQQTDEPKDPNQPDNLFTPVEHDFGSHGTFDSRARKFSLELWLDKNRGMVFAAMLVLIAAAVIIIICLKNHHHL
jgi:NAD(P)-dependent dehydrogenase (short-subunit alcohol dehydrogenase family)